MDGSNNFCDGANIDLTNTWTDYKEKFTLTPATAGTCTGALSIARMDSLNIQYLDITGDENRVTECSVVVWYTEMGGETKARRRNLLISGSGFEKIPEYSALGPYWLTGWPWRLTWPWLPPAAGHKWREE